MEYQYVCFFLLKKKKKKKKKRKSCLLPMYTYVPPFFGMGETFWNSNIKKKVAFTIKFFEVLFSDVGNFLYRTYQVLFFSFVCLLFFFVFFLTRKRRQSCSELAQTCSSTGKTHTRTLLFFFFQFSLFATGFVSTFDGKGKRAQPQQQVLFFFL